MKKLFLFLLLLSSMSGIAYSQASADSGYYYLKAGKIDQAIRHFESYAAENPDDTKIRLQLAYIYYDRKDYRKALRNFDYVSSHSKINQDIETSTSAAFVTRDQMISNSKSYLDIYFHNFYDSHQKNYIGNLIAHYNYKVSPNFYTGLYMDAYTDSRSTSTLIYNDRYVELGGFLRYHFLNNLFLEFRIGYARLMNSDSSTISIKPLLVYFTRFGDAKIFTSSNSSKKSSLYMDLYSAAMYDLKYQNSFLQGSLQEVLRFGTGGFSYVETYLMQLAQFDSRRLDYNNYAEVGGGIRFKPNIMYFPVLFVEPTYKVYFFGDVKNSFQVKAGFQFIFRAGL